ncbi:hypothetical protein CKO28_00835 [Rhodovibrio sodomensis]|uniref:N-acetyltransferase domain-containing protein n=1 Tax=Rhodovibrio sodomensis TaxID=1088 RepID=A0ABS1D8Y7_9PROT|nr:GNAT family N-acetyltransferase [Rhodovibrio sodomensis]MBK1666587.1 hypothetical protein [Rhodovibrio sodomensis]
MSTRTLLSRQAGVWKLLRESGPMTRELDGLTITTEAGDGPRQDLLEARLYQPGGLFEVRLPRTCPKFSAMAWRNGEPVGLAMLLNEANYPGHGMLSWGFALGLLGAYVVPDARGQGIARACCRGLDAHLTAILAGRRWRGTDSPVHLVSEPRLLALARPAFRPHVAARPGSDVDTDPNTEVSTIRACWRALPHPRRAA